MTNTPVFGILVGGSGSRMGGVAKGLLRAPSGETLLAHLRGLCAAVAPGSPIVLLGAHTAYADVALPQLVDTPAGIGPLGGVRALLLEAARLRRSAVVLGCDQPYLSAALLTRLVESDAPAVSVRLNGYWNPVFAHYRGSGALREVDALIASGQSSMARLLDALGASALNLTASEESELRDWDTPEDVSVPQPSDVLT